MTSMTKLTPIVLLTCLAPLYAAGTTPAEVRAPEWEISLSTGYGVVENPLAGKRDGESYFLPNISYYGKRFFLSNLTVGYSLLENENIYLDLVARPNEDGLYYLLDKSSSASDGVLSNFMTQFQAADPADTERRVSIVAGPSVTLVSDWVDVSFS